MRLTTLIPYFASVVNDDDHPLVQERRGRLAFKARREGLDADLAGRDPVPLKRRDRGAGALVLHADAARGIGRLTEEPADFDERRRTRRGAGDCVRHDGPAARRERGSPPFRLGQVEDLELGGASREQRGEGERGKGRSSLQKRHGHVRRRERHDNLLSIARENAAAFPKAAVAYCASAIAAAL